MTDDKEAIQNAEGEGGHREKVHRSDCLTMIPEERQPAFGGIWISRNPSQPSRDSGFRQMEAQLSQLAVHARRSPGGILSSHAKYQSTNLLTHPPSSSDTSGS